MIPLGLPREGNFVKEHQDLMDAALRRSPEEAEEILQLHIQRTSDSLVNGLRVRRPQADGLQPAVPA
jgi:DNA-binding GntR family transcriptional regulator